jgi:hypothetical protein
MIESIQSVFSTIATAASTLKTFRELLKGKKGDTRALLEELKENAGLCWLVMEMDTDPMKIINELRAEEYDRLLKTNFDFNSLKKQRISGDERIGKSDLSSFLGKRTTILVENIYDRIKDLKRIYRVDKENPKVRWGVRIINLQKRILLLLWHLKK